MHTENDTEITISFTRHTSFSNEPHGTFIDDDIAEGIEFENKALGEYPEAIRKAINVLVEYYLDKNEPEYPEE